LTDLYFEIQDRGDIIRIEPIQATDNNPRIDTDDYWIKSKVIVKGGAFSGIYSAEFTAADFLLFKRDIERLYREFNGTAKFEPLEGQLILDIHGDGLGHFEVTCKATDQLSNGKTLSFVITFDQTELPLLKNQLEKITTAFPIRIDNIADL
jgi:hypothetical protein